MICIECDKTDGSIYTSNPPQLRCSITGEFHRYQDICNVQESINKNSGCSFCVRHERGDLLYEMSSDRFDDEIKYNAVHLRYCPICGRGLK